MTFLEIQTLAKNRINDVEYDSASDNIIKDAINYAYMLFATTVDKKSKTATISISNSVVALPSDFSSVVDVFHPTNNKPLSKIDYDAFQDSILLRYDELTSVKLMYVYFPPKLVNDSDVIALKDLFAIATSTYACYSYMMHKRKLDAASMYYKEIAELISTGNTKASEGGK